SAEVAANASALRRPMCSPVLCFTLASLHVFCQCDWQMMNFENKIKWQPFKSALVLRTGALKRENSTSISADRCFKWCTRRGHALAIGDQAGCCQTARCN